jgi:hypothetical protein
MSAPPEQVYFFILIVFEPSTLKFHECIVVKLNMSAFI